MSTRKRSLMRHYPLKSIVNMSANFCECSILIANVSDCLLRLLDIEWVCRNNVRKKYCFCRYNSFSGSNYDSFSVYIFFLPWFNSLVLILTSMKLITTLNCSQYLISRLQTVAVMWVVRWRVLATRRQVSASVSRVWPDARAENPYRLTTSPPCTSSYTRWRTA